MTRNDAIKNFESYMKNHHIPYRRKLDDGFPLYLMQYAAENAPDRYVEACVWFYPGGVEARCYYNSMGAKICRNSSHRSELLRLLNFINARVFLGCVDPYGLYEPGMLYTPRIYLTEDDGFDITITTMIPYDFWELAPVETMDYLTMFGPELLDELAPSIFGVLFGKLKADDAVSYIREKILGENRRRGKIAHGDLCDKRYSRRTGTVENSSGENKIFGEGSFICAVLVV